MAGRPITLLALAGGAGSGTSTIGRALAERMPGTAVVHLDDCYHTDIRLAPTVPAFDGGGRIVDASDPRSLDPARITAAIGRHAAARLIVVEGVFALALEQVRLRAGWRAYVEAPADIRLARAALRKIEAGRNARHVLRGYLERGRTAHERHVAPSRAHADIVLDGTCPVPELVERLRRLTAGRRPAGPARSAGRAGAAPSADR
ncbi:uridine kinase family protein [Marinitenerispora sediminis]|uniref:Phosphoribulokinase/uridine kinase domain-containing protein n=1 Tax=Marinitenerispora sediminis TaxID=1931232 RepID=A0A368TA62_9ACTN|nr:hypothetical protein [Marinitenerispora sediminis]RCV52958.1 hypothetical protein DEF28_11510 [Marinitenerispora sediminis]RCV58437.1 hypothetical protein DEF23_08980 [Marinitenerispora sediminis]RCV61783.1 hypothetical protein DEF24_03385 [Marinitenerispora sediminis]